MKQKGINIQNIVIRPVVRQTQDIEKWRKALRMAESQSNPIRVPLYDLYEDLMIDGVLTSLVEKRILGVTKTPLLFVDKNGNEIPEISNLIYTAQFRKLRKEMMLAKFWGVSVIELSRENDRLMVFSFPRKHIRTDLKKIVWEQNGIEGAYYDQYNNILQVGDDRDLGLLLKAAPYVIYKRGGFGDWSKFAELFGMPFREARYDGYNEEVRRQLELAMQQYGAAQYAILPKEAEFKIWETHNTANSGDLYDTLRKACNEELAILILGQTETTMSSTSSGYAQAKTHSEVEDSINENDRIDELSILNEQVVPILDYLGFPVKDGSFNYAPSDDQLTVKEKAEVLSILKNNLQLPISNDYLYDEFGIPKPANQNSEPKENNQNEEKLSTTFIKKLQKKFIDFFAQSPA
ncbi:MAG: DUF935 family protein [Thermoflavifilum aggregans]|nr:DUF935 family protein [Thermoflavifilum aggregans]